GAFVHPNPPHSSFSLVLALIIPTASEKELFYELLRLRDTWPNQNIEIKGSSLDESQSAQVIRLLLRYDTLVQFIALDANTHPDPVVEDFKNRQADGVTANITREHHPGPIPHYHQLGEAVRAMPNQLFLQAFAKEPLIFITEGDYSHFDARFGFTEATADPEMLRHSQWLNSVYGKPPKTKDWVGIDAKQLLTEQREFQDSRDSLGLQLADTLAAILRRALNNRLQFSGWKDFGGLLVRHSQPGKEFIQLGPGDDIPRLSGHTGKVCGAYNKWEEEMIGISRGGSRVFCNLKKRWFIFRIWLRGFRGVGG